MSNEQNNQQNQDGARQYQKYYGPMPFYSYDELIALKHRRMRRRRGIFACTLLAVCMLSVVFGVWIISGTLNLTGDAGGGRTFVPSGTGTPPISTSGKNTPEQPYNTPGYTGSDVTLDITAPDEGQAPSIIVLDVSGIVDAVEQSVVGVVSESYTNFSTAATASGIIMTEDGYIITNHHVISGGNAITVVLHDGTNYPAYLIGSDQDTDLAVLKIEAKGLKAAQFGDSDELKVGEAAIVIGSPGGLELQGTTTLGIISGLNRALKVGNTMMNLVQTDASVNPGNSGGPIINKYSQVVAVTSIKIGGDYEGIGFGIPINTAKPIIEQLIQQGYVSGKPLVGVYAKTVSPMAAAFYSIPTGLMVDAVEPESDAFAKGLAAGDIITSVDGQPVSGISSACTARNNYKAGDTIVLEVFRKNRYYEIEVKLIEQNQYSGQYNF